jgi:hypothetical protein
MYIKPGKRIGLVLERIADHPSMRMDDLAPRIVAAP